MKFTGSLKCVDSDRLDAMGSGDTLNIDRHRGGRTLVDSRAPPLCNEEFFAI
jgi:hypothetical protein